MTYSHRLLSLFLPLLLAATANADTAAPRRTLGPDVQAAQAGQPREGLQPTPASVHALLGSVPAYALEMTLSFARRYSTFDASAPANTAIVGPTPADAQLWTGTFVRDDFSKQYLLGDANVLRTISTASGAVTDIGDSVPPVEGEYWVGMKWDPTTDQVFAAACNHTVGAGCHLYTIDTATAAVTPVAPIAGASGDYVLMDLAINSAGEIYAVNLIEPYDNYLVKLDKVSGAVTVIGPTGVNAAYAQGMDFDKRTDTLYWAAFGALGAGGAFQGQVYTVDTATGGVTHLGTTPNGGSEIWALSIATSAPSGQAWNFDDVTAPALPAGWTTAASGVGAGWATQTAVHASAPNAAHSAEATVAGEASLYSPVVRAGNNYELSFRHRWNLDISPYDGGVLEIAIDGGAFNDIIAAGGTFVSGGYTDLLFGCCGGNPLGARNAWTRGNQSTFVTTRVTLPSAAAGRNVQFRWRFGTDSSTAAAAPNGWWIDSVSLGAPGPSGPAATLSAASLEISVPAGATLAEAVNLSNVGAAALTFSSSLSSSNCSASTGPAWLTATPASGTLAAGQGKDVWVAANASTLAPGQYYAVLCVASNDPAHATLSVPVAVTVTPAENDDGLFCSSFEGGENGGCATTTVGNVVYSGPLNWPVPADLDGLAIDLVTGAHGPWNAATIADINLYSAKEASGASLHVYWYADLVTTANVGGLIDISPAGGIHFSVLQRGARFGPEDSMWFVPTSGPLDNWLPGATGYLGLTFLNEQTGQLNYGYVHVQAGSGAGFPATVLDYAYDRSGAAIAIP
ncbi:hypothetical protein DFR29_103122 [Tahibacter aquaticus]|uniref:BACON domain-containing protein n=1 Tax=Tahibacter aquaticus TaxID=520092 RepID=A0A4R6Z4G6_9GAMM|nr:hypothetical protein [Tahibacter aquaticus]TDR46588.1 hypothetical protein DFR29_103122 [Tahibacter aquaticus]